MSETTLRRTLPEAYTIGLGGGDYLGIVGDGLGTTHAVAYTGGEWTEELASTSAFDASGDLVWPPVFAAGRYLIVVPTFGDLLVWDLESNTVAAYTPPAGWSVLGAAAVGATVYWVERETEEHGAGPYATDVRLKAAGWDLVAPDILCARAVSVSGGESVDSPLGTGAVIAVLFTEASAIASWSWVDQMGEDEGVVRVRLDFAGSSAQADAAESLGELGLATAAGEAAMANRNGLLDGSILLLFPDDEAGDPTSAWPTTSGYALAPFNAGLTTDGLVAVVYGVDDDGPALVRAPITGAASAPTERAPVADFGELGAPNYLYPRD